MRYENQKCPVCGEVFTQNDDVVVCPECATPHHRACFENFSHCANEHLHEEGFVWKAEEAKTVEKTAEPEENTVEETAKAETEENKETIVCPNCKTECLKRQLVCNNCGAILNPEIEKEFQPPEVYIDGMPVDNNDFIDAEKTVKVKEAACFIQRNKEGYIKAFLDAKVNNRRPKFNFAAFVFGEYWFFYRKIYKAGLVIAGIFFALECFFNAFFIRAFVSAVNFINANAEAFESGKIDPELYEELYVLIEKGFQNKGYMIALAVCLLLSLAVRILCGIYANSFYLGHIRQTTRKLKTLVPHERTYYTYLYAKGGTTIFNAFLIGMAVYYFTQFILSFAMM